MVITGFCVWVAGQPGSVVASIARAVAGEVAHHCEVEQAVHSNGAGWPELAARLRDRTGRGVAVVLATTAADETWRDGVRAAVPRLVEVHVGEAPAGSRAPEVVVAGDGARAGESARAVLRHLAAAGYTEPLDEYSDDDEAAVSGRLQAFGYL